MGKAGVGFMRLSHVMFAIAVGSTFVNDRRDGTARTSDCNARVKDSVTVLVKSDCMEPVSTYERKRKESQK